jgi:hypothetical protein
MGEKPKTENDPEILRPLISSWYDSLKNPAETQNKALQGLLKGYSRTSYGQDHNAANSRGIAEYREKFPILDYKTLNPYLIEIEKGNYAALLPEPLLCWVMTRGSTGPAKVLPATQTHVNQILICGARAIINHAIKNRDFDLLNGKVLNLNFPSNVHTIIKNGRKETYGYSSGTYAKLIPTFNQIGLVPLQEEIDALNPGLSKGNWEERFELAYQRALKENVIAAMGVTPVILSFAKYVKRAHGKNPKDIWNMRALFCTSVRKIQFRYAPELKRYYGRLPIVEVYSATEGVFAQQIDSLPYVTPNYDTYFFEVKTKNEVKMLHELARGDWGRLIVSSCLFPRYSIGDLIEAAGNNYFRVIGRDNAKTILEHKFYRALFRWAL